MDTPVAGRRAGRVAPTANTSATNVLGKCKRESSRALRRARSSLSTRSSAHWWKVCWLYPGPPGAKHQQRWFESLPRASHKPFSSPVSCHPKSLAEGLSDHALRLPPAHSYPSAWLDLVLAQSDLLHTSGRHLDDGGRMTKSLTSQVSRSSSTVVNAQAGESRKTTTTATTTAAHNDSRRESTSSQQASSDSRDIQSLDHAHQTTSAAQDFELDCVSSSSNEMARFNSQPSLNGTLRLMQGPLGTLWSRTKAKTFSTATKVTNVINFFIQYRGAEWRRRQLDYQMPTHDVELFRYATPENKLVRTRLRKSGVKTELLLGTEHPLGVCHKCNVSIRPGSHYVRIQVNDQETSKQSSGSRLISSLKTSLSEAALPLATSESSSSSSSRHDTYHLECFTCHECDHLLVDLKAHVYMNRELKTGYGLYCGRHFVEIFKPRCPYCDQLIFDEECTEAEGRAWHIGHFCCTECKRSLGGQQYIMACADKRSSKLGAKNAEDDEKKKAQQIPYCLTCFDILFGELCEECGELIGCEVGAIIHDARSWHADDACFRCSLCLKSLLGKPFLPAMDGRIYCSLACSQAMATHQKERLRRQNRLHTLQHRQQQQVVQPQIQQQPQPQSFSLVQLAPQLINRQLPPLPANISLPSPPPLPVNISLPSPPPLPANISLPSPPPLPIQEQQQQQSVCLPPPPPSVRLPPGLARPSLPAQTPISAPSIRENRDNFLRSMTLGRYEKQMMLAARGLTAHENAHERLRQIWNLAQHENYEEFIKQNLHKCFTSKYDWSKEKEFSDQGGGVSLSPVVVDSGHEMTVSSQASDQQSIDSLSWQAERLQLSGLEIEVKTIKQQQQQQATQQLAQMSRIKAQRQFEGDGQETSPARHGSPSESCSSQQPAKHIQPNKANGLPFPSPSTSVASSEHNSSTETAPIAPASSPRQECLQLEVITENQSSTTSSMSSIRKDEPAGTSVGILKYKPRKLEKEISPGRIYSSPQQPRRLEQMNEIKPERHETRTPVGRSKSVSFDPKIEEKDGGRRRRTTRKSKYDDCSDSCSSCSTCSSSSSDFDDEDDDDGFDLTNFQPQQPQSKPKQQHADTPEGCSIS